MSEMARNGEERNCSNGYMEQENNEYRDECKMRSVAGSREIDGR